MIEAKERIIHKSIEDSNILERWFVYPYMNRMGFLAWTSFWSCIYYKDIECMNNKKIQRHELKHIEQIDREGYIKFSIKYLWYSFKYGYRENKYEVEARAAEDP